MIAIPNMERPESCWQCYNEGCDHWAEYGYDNSAVCPLIDIVTCGECKYWTGDCTNERWQSPTDDYLPQTNADDFCSYGERRADYTVFTVNKPKGIETPLKGDGTVFHQKSKITQMKGE